MNRKQLILANRKKILDLAAARGAYNVRIFGSVARGDDDERSDVDFLVDMKPGRTLLDLGGLLMDLENFLGCSVDVVTEKGLRKRLKDSISKEAIVL